MSVASPRLLAVMKLPRAVPALLRVVAALLAALASPLFPNAVAVIAALTKAFDTADAAETLAKTRAKGTVAARNVALAALIAEVHTAKALVQQTADANPASAAAVIAGAGMAQRKETTRSKAPFAASPQFRFRSLSTAGVSAWSQTVTLLVQ
jgi:predicted DNA-binding ribbon-helix-helix protein